MEANREYNHLSKPNSYSINNSAGIQLSFFGVFAANYINLLLRPASLLFVLSYLQNSNKKS